MSKGNFSKWTKDNKVLLVMIPLIVGIHWGWYELQKIPALVPPSERKEMPIIGAYKAYKAKIMQKFESNLETSDAEK